MPKRRTFEAPGPGSWELESAHLARPASTFGADAFVRAFPKGFAEGTARFGLLLSHMKPAIVNGFFYMQPAPFGAPEGATSPPPNAVLWLLSRLHPKMRARIAVCREAFENKLWREDLERWDSEIKPDAIAKHLAVQSVTPAKLSDAELAAYVKRCNGHLEDMICLHHRFTIGSSVATGDFLAHVIDWTGAKPGEIVELLRGSSPISKGVAADELDALAAAIRESGAARDLLASDAPGQVIVDGLVSMAGEVGARASAYLEIVRHRSVGYDVSDPTCGELPDVLVRGIRASVAGATARKDEGAARLSALRERVAPAHREHFDELLTEARHVNRLRDERGAYSDAWGTGLARRALLEAGRRLKAGGKIADRDYVTDLTHEEIADLLSGGAGPGDEALLDRVTWRTTMTTADAPPWLNEPPSPPPPAHLFPAPARRATRAIDAILTNLLKDSDRDSTKTTVRGLSVNSGSYDGTARVVNDTSEFTRIRQGDVLVARSTSPYFNVVLPLLGAIVTDRGGVLCHAAIVAREYGIPGVVGTRVATTTIPDGARVRVDGEKGEVTIIAPA
ncbi:MAG: hypothetical protein IPI67_27885 [Myxococcales bacterium]|nr:hypothetical protein [Myxococcales bacterium]